ncbi:asparagine synthase (glutamine-hydrolyzing) [Kiloniella litopenaei]|uniref:asparagine synthase (glutamine-hydrolyzing) n=1 Tax=Kiloniella litopenaei TaxID=1549748 RepID=UPI003BAA678A
MCGIAGRFGAGSTSDAQEKKVLDLLYSRGPDCNGVLHENTSGDESVFLAHTRLSIIDLSPNGRQPFTKGNLTLCFNGELYNYREVRESLKREGASFQTDTDTEVLLEAFRHWGNSCYQRLEGMWALVILDHESGTFHVSRDRFGEKPLYFTRDAENFYFSSDIRVLFTLANRIFEPDFEKAGRFLVNGFKSIHKETNSDHEESWYKGIYIWPAGAAQTLKSGKDSIAPRAYWDLDYNPDESMSLEEAIEGTRERLFEAVRLRLRSDVPLAFCLSGGVDSGALATIASKHFNQNIHTFSILDLDERYNEWDTLSITQTALDCDNRNIYLGRDGFLERLTRQVQGNAAPVATVSYYIHDFLSEAMAENGFRVAISGSGADELFTGYYDHYNFWLADQVHSPVFDQLASEWYKGYGRHVRNPVLKDPMSFVNDPTNRSHIFLNRDLFNSLMLTRVETDFEESSYCRNILRNRMLNEQRHEILPVLLEEDDRNSMRHSIENRSPFLDSKLAEFSFQVPNRHLIRKGMQKFLLREAAAGFLPDAVRLDKRKRGFNASITTLFDSKNQENKDWLCDESSRLFELVDRPMMSSFLEQDMSTNSLSKFLFSVLSTKLFLDINTREWLAA